MEGWILDRARYVIACGAGFFTLLVVAGAGHSLPMNGAPDPSALPPPVCNLDAYPAVDCVADERYAMFFATDATGGDAVTNTPVAFASRAFTPIEATSIARDDRRRSSTDERSSTDTPEESAVRIEPAAVAPMTCVRTAAAVSRWPFTAKPPRSADGLFGNCESMVAPGGVQPV